MQVEYYIETFPLTAAPTIASSICITNICIWPILPVSVMYFVCWWAGGLEGEWWRDGRMVGWRNLVSKPASGVWPCPYLAGLD